MITKEAKDFIGRYVSGEFSPEEHETFLRWMESATAEDLEAIADEYETVESDGASVQTGPSPEWIAKMEKKLDLIDLEQRKGLLRRMWSDRKWRRGMRVAAAVAFAVISTGIYKWYSHSSGSAAPGLTQRPTEVLSYTVARGKALEMKELPDGSKVWLNTASTIRYPRTFAGGERTVELSGEAYFQVEKNVNQPFRVKVRDIEIEVLGTEFNVKAYEEDAGFRTSLLDGSVRITRGAESKILKKGEQAVADFAPTANGPGIQISPEMDEARVIAWKNGKLDFNNDDVTSVMNEIGRNYDLDVIYTDKDKIVAKHFVGQFPRTIDIHAILRELEFQHIHAKIEGRTIKVVP